MEEGHWSYDALEEFATAQIIDMAGLSTRPMTRFQVADKIADIVIMFQDEEFIELLQGQANLERLEELLRQLVDEFREELILFGIGIAEVSDESLPLLSYRIADPLRSRKIYALLDKNKTLDLYNEDGWELRDGLNLKASLQSWARLSHYFAVNLKPFVLANEDQKEVDLEKAYVKLGFWNFDIELGRDSLWWGPAKHGAMLISNNALPLEILKLSNQRPFYYPGFLKKLGKSNIVFFLAELEEKRTIPKARLAGLRFEINPKDYLSFGISRTAVFGGKGRPHLSLSDYWDMLLAKARTEFVETRSNSDQKGSFDVRLALKMPEAVSFIVSNAEIYGEWAGEDRFAPWENEAPGLSAGAFLPDLFGVNNLDLRLEYATAKRSWYRHTIYLSGYKYKGDILGHHMGGDADDLYLNISGQIQDKLKIEVSLDRERSGLREDVTQKKNEFEIMLSFLELEDVKINLDYRLWHFDDFENVSGRSSKDHLLTLEVEKTF